MYQSVVAAVVAAVIETVVESHGPWYTILSGSYSYEADGDFDSLDCEIYHKAVSQSFDYLPPPSTDYRDQRFIPLDLF